MVTWRRVSLGIAIVIAVGVLVWWHVASLGCGLGNTGAYPLYEADRSVESPSEARVVIHEAYWSNESVASDYQLGRVGPNWSAFNQSYVYRVSPKETLRKGLPDRSGMVDEGEEYYYFRNDEARYGVGVTREGEVFLVEYGIC